MKATIFDIQRNSYVDGPGIRTTVFFKGCNLKCKWCHNPESQNPKPQIMFYKDKCTMCDRCKGITPNDTAFICFNDAKQICGREYTVDEVIKEIIKDKAFYENSGGGVTFSGGECMLNTDFLCEVLKKSKENGIHTAVDTAGYVDFEKFTCIIPYTDLFLYDIKCFDDEKHKKYVGVSNTLILKNLSLLFKEINNTDINKTKEIIIRIPVIVGVNDSIDEMTNIKNFLSVCSPHKLPKIELLPYHQMGEHKYNALNMEISHFDVPLTEHMDNLKKIFL